MWYLFCTFCISFEIWWFSLPIFLGWQTFECNYHARDIELFSVSRIGIVWSVCVLYLIEIEMDACVISIYVMVIAIDTIYVFLTTYKCSKVLRNAYTIHVHAAAHGVFDSFSIIYIYFPWERIVQCIP